LNNYWNYKNKIFKIINQFNLTIIILSNIILTHKDDLMLDHKLFNRITILIWWIQQCKILKKDITNLYNKIKMYLSKIK